MSRKKYIIVRELDPESVTSISEIQKKHFLTLGYRPCLLADGSTKWLTEAQRVYRESKRVSNWSLKRVFRKDPRAKRRRRKHRSQLHKFFLEYWLIFTILAVVAVGLLLFVHFWHP
jgi:hypothetical protein